MDLLIFFNGRKEAIIKAANLNPDETIAVKADEKILASPQKVKAIIKAHDFAQLYFGCIDLTLQRFHVFIMLYYFLFGIKNGALIDEKGARKEYSFARLLFSELPKVAVEVVATAFVVVFYYIKIFTLKLKYLKQ